jgi:hypothetical protein
MIRPKYNLDRCTYSDIDKLKALTLKPPLFAESLANDLESEMMEWKYKGNFAMVEYTKKQLEKIEREIFIDSL